MSSVTQGLRRSVTAAAGSRVGVFVALASAFVLVAASSWVILQVAAIALTVAGWLLIPLGLLLVFALF